LIERLQERNARLQEQNERLQARVAELEARLGQNSSNSNRPPSSDSPDDRKQRPKPSGSGRPRGGQPGHKGHRRELVPPEQVTRQEDVFPDNCGHCGRKLPRKQDANPLIHQVVELPKLTPDVTEYRMHHVGCTCGHVTSAPWPTGAPIGMCGPRLLALISLLTGMYHLSRRQAKQFVGDVLGIRISLGALSESEERVSEAVAPVVAEAREHALEQPVKHVDATGWRQGDTARSLWTIATQLVTVFCLTVDATKATVKAMLDGASGILVSDRAPQFKFWAIERRQVCWAHLLRKFADFSERPDAAGDVGKRLLFWTELIFRPWHEFRDGELSRAKFRRIMAAAREHVEACLERGVKLGVRGMSGSCADILEHREALWTFVNEEGVEPTNNHAERELRAFVLWRKKSFGSQSERGCRFAERIMTVAHTLRKQGRQVLEFLVEACNASLGLGPIPSLLPPNT
jgi:transposase